MGKRKRNAPTIEEVLDRPWCYYCERDFDDLKVLIAHQKAKHYKCDQCNRRLNTAGGLSVHMSQVHKETLTQIENALPGRADIGVEIFGMHGIPADVLEAHKNRITSEYFKAVAERRAETGNPPSGTTTDGTSKKPKIETAEEIRKRLAEHKAKREAEKEAKAQAERNSSNTTPFDGISPFNTPGNDVTSQATPHQHLEAHAQHQASPPQAGFPQALPGLAPNMPGYGSPMAPVHSPASNPIFAGPPQGMPPYIAPSPHNAPPTMLQQGWAGPPTFTPPTSHFMPMRPQNSFSPKPANAGFQSPTVNKQPEPPKPAASLPAIPGLPSRPAVDAPSFSREDMARLHAGGQARQGVPASNNFSPTTHPSEQLSATAGTANDQAPISTPQSFRQSQGDHIDGLIHSITNGQSESTPANHADDPIALQHDNLPLHVEGMPPKQNGVAPHPPPALTAEHQPPQNEPRSKSTTKKSKNANIKTKLVYSDNDTSPEEKRALSKRYAFTRDESTQYVLGDVGPAVTGAVRGADDVMDTQGAH